MSGALARTALRLAGIEALNADPVIAAACAGRVYDSLIGAFQSTDPVPVIVLASEDDRGEAYSANNGGPPFDQIVDLTLEITVCASVADSDDIDVFVPATDRESELLIDLLEQRAVDALTAGDTPQSRLLRKVVTRRVTAYRSVRYASEDTGVKLARRLVALTAVLKGDDTDARDEPEGPFAVLPDPLRTVAASLPAGSSGALTCLALVARIDPSAVPSPGSVATPAPAPAAVALGLTYAPQRLTPSKTPSETDLVETFAQEIDPS